MSCSDPIALGAALCSLTSMGAHVVPPFPMILPLEAYVAPPRSGVRTIDRTWDGTCHHTAAGEENGHRIDARV